MNNVEYKTIDSHIHCGIRNVHQPYPMIRALLEPAGISHACMFAPVEDIYNRYDPYFTDNPAWLPLDETTKDAIMRIIKKKGGFEIEVQRLLWIMELFFVFRGKEGTLDVEQATKIHGIGFYFLVSPKTSKNEWQKEEFHGIERPDIIFKWFKLDELNDINIKPDCLKQLLNQIPSSLEHVVCRTE